MMFGQEKQALITRLSLVGNQSMLAMLIVDLGVAGPSVSKDSSDSSLIIVFFSDLACKW